VKATRPTVQVSAGGKGVVSHAGSRLLVDLADRSTLTGQLSAVSAGRISPQTAHDPGRLLTGLAVMIADGGECLSDIATFAVRPGVFGPVASDSTVSRGAGRRHRRRPGRSAPDGRRRGRWRGRSAQQAGHALPASTLAGAPPLALDGRPVPVIDEDETITIAYIEKEQAWQLLLLTELRGGSGVALTGDRTVPTYIPC